MGHRTEKFDEDPDHNLTLGLKDPGKQCGDSGAVEGFWIPRAPSCFSRDVAISVSHEH